MQGNKSLIRVSFSHFHAGNKENGDEIKFMVNFSHFITAVITDSNSTRLLFFFEKKVGVNDFLILPKRFDSVEIHLILLIFISEKYRGFQLN